MAPSRVAQDESLRELGAEPSEAFLCLVAARRGGFAIPECRPRGIPSQAAHAAQRQEYGIVGLGDSRCGGSVAAGGGTLEGESRGYDVAVAQQLVSALDERFRHLRRKRQRRD